MHIRTTRDAAGLGIETVYQDLALADNLDIVQNMFLGRERLRRGLLDEDSMERAAAETLSSLRVTTVRSIRQPVASLSGGQRQSVAVAKAVMWNSKVVLLDEPTAALGVVQTRMVLDLVRRLRDHGLAVMVISHNLNDVFEVADRIAVLHLGRMVAEGPASGFDRQSVIEYMTTGGKNGKSSLPLNATAVKETRLSHGWERERLADRRPPSRRGRPDRGQHRSRRRRGPARSCSPNPWVSICAPGCSASAAATAASSPSSSASSSSPSPSKSSRRRTPTSERATSSTSSA